MGRTIKEYKIPYALPHDFPLRIQQLLASDGYAPKKSCGEDVFRNGIGLLTGPKFFKISYLPDRIRVESWIKFAAFPFIFIGEDAITTKGGTIPKSSARTTLAKLENLICSSGAAPIPETLIGQPLQTSAAPQKSYVFCGNCGARVLVGTRFCTTCGTRIE